MERFSICRAKVVYEVLNTEVIAIDFNTGNYYALLHVAKHVWQMVESHMSFDQMAQAISNLYSVDVKTSAEDLRPFIQDLLENGLIERSSESGEALSLASPSWPYDPPKMQVYTDVQNLLLLDPIHEVTEAGWPEKLSVDEEQPVF